jgi:hypothetical protein
MKPDGRLTYVSQVHRRHRVRRGRGSGEHALSHDAPRGPGARATGSTTASRAARGSRGMSTASFTRTALGAGGWRPPRCFSTTTGGRGRSSASRTTSPR